MMDVAKQYEAEVLGRNRAAYHPLHFVILD